MRKELIVILLISLIYSLIAVPALSAEECVKISVQDSRGVRYVNYDIYAQMDIMSIPDYIGKTGKDGWLSWCDYISAPLGFPYQLVAQEDGCQRGSTIVFLFTGKPMNIVIPKTNEKCDDVGGINFTSIKLGYISVNEADSGDLNFDYIFRAQKANGTSAGIGFNNASSLSLNAFITGLSVPNNKFWVNLGPDEPDRIIDDQLRESEVGRIMLEADLQMKRDFAKYTCAHETDNASMDRLLAEKKNSLVQQCMDKFPGEIKDLTNVHFTHTIRYWIVPDKIYAYTNGNEIYIINATLAINSIVEETHFRLSDQDPGMLSAGCRDELNRSVEEYSEYDRKIEERMITPNVIEDVNRGEEYENLREVYVALALSQWYKSNIARSNILLNSFESSNSTASTTSTPWTPTEIWGRYIDSIKNNDERCTWWFNTTTKTATGTINKTILRSRGGVRFRNIIDHFIKIDEMPSELQVQVKRAIMSGYIDEEDYVLFGNRLHLDSSQKASIAGSRTLSNVTQPDLELARVWLNKGVALDDLGKYDEAIEAYDEAIRLNPNYAKAWFNKGLSLDDLGKYDEAAKAYDEAIRLDPNNATKPWFNKGLALDELGEYDEAVKAYDEAIRLDPNNAAKAWFTKGLALDELGEYDEAVKAYDEAIKIDPNNATKAWFNKGLALDELGEYDEAVKAYDEAIRLDPNNAAKAWFNKGLALDELGEYDEAVKAYDEVIKIDPNDAKAWNNKGIVLDDLGIYDAAIEAYDEAIRLDPHYAMAWNNKGLALRKLDRTEEAEAAFAKAKELGYSR